MKKELIKISIPIFFTVTLSMLASTVDTLMLSRYSDLAASAVGNANQLIFLVYMFMQTFGIGSSIIFAQYYGAKKYKALNSYMNTSIIIMFTMGILLSIIINVFAENLLYFINAPKENMMYSLQFMRIIGSGFMMIALYEILSIIMNSQSKTFYPMIVNIIFNVLNIIGNWTVLYGPLKKYNFGVAGVAISTTTSRVITLIMLIYIFKKVFKFKFDYKLGTKNMMLKSIKIFKLSWTSVIHILTYNVLQVLITSVVNLIGLVALTSKIYVQSVTMYSFIFAIALARGAGIIVGQSIGAKQIDKARKIGNFAIVISIIFSASISIMLWIFSDQLIQIFTHDKNIIYLSKKIFFINIFLEIGRAKNIVANEILKAAGDVISPLRATMFIVWLFIIPVTFIYSKFESKTLVVIWIIMTLDEVLRGIWVLVAWKKGKWINNRV